MTVQPHAPRPAPSSFSFSELLRLHVPRLLVVEDDRELEPLVRLAARSLPRAAAVDWCTTAERARVLLARQYYDAVLADYVLEGDDAGIALRADCCRLQPQAVFAMTSSYALDEYLHSVGGLGHPFLPKPFDLWSCRHFLERILDREVLS